MNGQADLTPQRWERPLNFPPGFWKLQLPTRYLDMAGRGDIAALREVLAEHPEYLNKRGAHGRTLLWEAVRRGRLDTVKWLVEQGADFQLTGCYNSESYVQLSPYCAAIYYRRAAVADYLRTLPLKHDIYRAAFLGDTAQVTRELDANPALLNADDPADSIIYHVPLLAYPLVGGHIDLLENLLRRGAVVAPYSGQLLNLAAHAGRLDMIQRLVYYDAEIASVDSGIFVMTSDMTLFRYLLEHGAPVNRHSKNTFPPIVFLSRPDKGEHPEKIALLLEYGADVNARGPNGKTALHQAASAGFVKVIDLLLRHGADTTLRDDDGHTALDLARANGREAAVGILQSA